MELPYRPLFTRKYGYLLEAVYPAINLVFTFYLTYIVKTQGFSTAIIIGLVIAVAAVVLANGMYGHKRKASGILPIPKSADWRQRTDF